jgi:hypothetical protein
MPDDKRKICIIKQGKKYLGGISIPSDMYRTTDYFNRPGMMKHRDNQGTLDSFIQLYDVEMIIDDKIVLKRQDVANIRVIDIILYWDEIDNLGTPVEQKRAKTMMENIGRPELNRVTVVTPMYGSQFYEVSGAFYGRFKRAMVNNFLSLTNATVDYFFKKPETDKWNKKSVTLPHGFVALNMSFVDSYSLLFEE